MEDNSGDGGVDAKIVLLGDSAVGKSALALRYVRNQFIENGDPTIGACFFTKRVVQNGVAVKLQIWDTAGQERFRSLAPMYYHGAVAALLVFDMTTPKTFERVKSWAEELSKNVTEEIVIAVVGAKMDLFEALPPTQRPTHITRDARAYAEEIGAVYGETSAKEGKSIELLFNEIVKRIITMKHLTPGSSSVSGGNSNSTGGNSGSNNSGNNSSSNNNSNSNQGRSTIRVDGQNNNGGTPKKCPC